MLVLSVLSSALICASVPVTVSVLVPLPLTTAPLMPAATVSVPSVTASVAVSTPPRLSTSLTDMLFLRFRLICSAAL